MTHINPGYNRAPTTTTPTVVYKPKIKTSDIDAFIGRATIKDEVTNIDRFWTYGGFYYFVSNNLTENTDISKNDVARTWNLITRNPIGLSKVKRLPFTRLNLIDTFLVFDTSYNDFGNKRESNGYLPIFSSDDRIDRTIKNIETILLFFLKPWHFKLKRYDTGLALWVNPKIDKMLHEKYKPGNMVKYYENTAGSRLGGTVVWDVTEYPYVPKYMCSTNKKKVTSSLASTVARGVGAIVSGLLH